MRLLKKTAKQASARMLHLSHAACRAGRDFPLHIVPSGLAVKELFGEVMKKRFVNFDRVIGFLMLGIIGIVLTGCSVMSKGMLREADKDIRFESIRRDPSAYAGKTVILGGYVLEARNLKAETRLLVLQAPLTVRDEPRSSDLSEGRFTVVYEGFLDPVVYERGRKITVAGTVLGEEDIRINDHTVTIPVFEAREIYLWDQPEWPGRYHYYYGPDFRWPDPYFHHWWHPRYYWGRQRFR
jgi:outer membrane lipoprotein